MPGFEEHGQHRCSAQFDPCPHIQIQKALRRFSYARSFQCSKMALCPSGEIGRHSGLKIRRLPARERTGSIPVSGTNQLFYPVSSQNPHTFIRLAGFVSDDVMELKSLTQENARHRLTSQSVGSALGTRQCLSIRRSHTRIAAMLRRWAAAKLR
jgi:hypothetical protein